MRKFWLLTLFVIGFVIAATVITTAQDDSTCPILVQTAIDSVEILCSGTGRNQVCYGNIRVTAAFSDTIDSQFSEPGDIANLVDIDSIQLGAMDIDANEWGVALMQVQANLPDTLPGQNVTFVMFGDVDVQTIPAPPELTATISASGAINVRSGPGTTYGVVDSIASGTSLVANGRNDAADWLRVTLPNNAQPGWVATSLLRPDGDTDSLVIVTPDTPVYGEMQAFYLRSGVGDARCAEAPHSGLLIQTPQGAGEIEFTINEVQIRMGSTVFFQAVAGHQMTVYVLEGQAHVAAFDVSRTVPAGASVRVPLDENTAASGPPGEVESYDTDALQALPIQLLPESIEVASPLSENDIAALDVCTVSVDATVNLRGGPGTVYGRQGALTEGATVRVMGQADGTDGFIWWQLLDESWVRSDVVETTGNCGDVQVVVDLPPVPTPAPAVIGGGGDIVLVGSGGSCAVTPTVRAGRIRLNMGISRQYWATCEDAMADGQSRGLAIFTGTGSAPTNYRLTSSCHWNAAYSEWGISTEADVILTPGVYTYTSAWLDGETGTCTFTVVP